MLFMLLVRPSLFEKAPIRQRWYTVSAVWQDFVPVKIGQRRGGNGAGIGEYALTIAAAGYYYMVI